MIFYFLLTFLFFVSTSEAKILDLEYGRTVALAQEGKWEDAKNRFKALLVDRSEEPDFLYDAGVASFQTKDFTQAAAYFESVSESDNAPDSLKEQAHFNLGNTNIELKNLQEAVKNYEAVLKINPENEKAKHNLEIAKKMLEQQQQEQQRDQNKDKQQQEQQQQDEKDKQDEEKQNQDKQQQQQENSDQQKQEKQSGQRDKDEREDGSDKDQDEKDGEQPRRDEKRSEDRQDKQRDKREPSKDDLDKKRDDKQRDRDEHNKKSEQKKQTQQHDKDDKTKEEKEQVEQPIPAGMQKRKDLDKRTMEILQAIEKIDKEGNKELMKATVSKEMVGEYGQNRW